jgi:aspartyl-tRNA(Asn)/glutamyl-tRNA(Gln) amidotransferase subunit C
MSVTPEEVRHIAKLARLRLSDSEQEVMAEQLSSILDYVEQLNELDVSDVEPMSHVLDLVNATREDAVKQRVKHEDALKNAPSADSDYFRVPRVIE